MYRKIIKTSLPFLLSAVFILTPAAKADEAAGDQVTVSAAADIQGKALVDKKDEVIYATLEPGGDVSAIYAVNSFEVKEPGIITDYGDYSSVINLTDTSPLGLEGSTVTVPAGVGQVYYQGNLNASDLPWTFNIQYILDGVAVTPQALAGRSGELEIRIGSSQNKSVNPVFYENYMLQISLTLDTEKCSDIQAQGAVQANSGKSRMLSYTVLPGSDADISVRSTVKDFTMAGIDISAIPFSMSFENPDTGDMLDQFQSLADAVSALNQGIKEFSNGTEGLDSGAAKLSSGSKDIQKGLNDLKDNAGQITDGSLQIKNALNQIAQAVNQEDLSAADLSALTQLPQGLTDLAGGLDKISAGMGTLKDSFNPAYQALDNAISSIPKSDLTQEQIKALYSQTDSELYPALDILVKSYTAGKTVQGTYDQVKAAFTAVESTLDQLSGNIDTISASLKVISENLGAAMKNMDSLKSLPDLFGGLQELSDNYDGFHDGLIKYTGGVKQLADGYGAYKKGIGSLKSGTSELAQGASELYSGSSRLNDEVSKLPATVQSEINKLTEQYSSTDFTPVSFLSPLNENVELVQFVIKSAAVELPKKEIESSQSEPKKETFWDRLTALFT